MASAGWAAVPAIVGWFLAVGLAAARPPGAPWLIAAVGLATILASLAARWRYVETAWAGPIRSLARNVSAFNDQPDESWDLPSSPGLGDLVGPIRDLQARFLVLRDRLERRGDDAPAWATESGEFASPRLGDGVMTRSGSYEPPESVAYELMASSEFTSLDMISRLEPRTWRWLDSSPSEQEFLGWSIDQLRGMSFLDVVQEGDRELARQQLRAVLARGEGHGLIYRITTARGETKSVEINAGARYGTDRKVTHVRCRMADVTAKLRDEDNLRRRTDELIQANDHLRRANRESQALRAELQANNERLARAVEELSRKNRELDEFTRVVSHDLQEPLRTLIAFSTILLDEQADRLDEAGREHVRYLVDASRRLRALIQDLLELSRAGKVVAEFARVDLDEVVATVRADLAELARSRGAAIRVAAALGPAWGDRARIGQLLTNLIGNGLKYNAGPGPWVEVASRVEPDGRSVVISVRDNGIGIDPRHHARIFQLFRRLHTREEYEGTGAGLAISRKIAQAHGGRIWVESAPGQGSTFFVALPTPPEEARP